MIYLINLQHSHEQKTVWWTRGAWDVEQKLTETLVNDEGLRVDLTAAQVDVSFFSTTLNNLLTVDLPATVAALQSQISLKENILTFNDPLSNSNSVVVVVVVVTLNMIIH